MGEVSLGTMAKSLTDEEIAAAVKKESARRAHEQETGVARHDGEAIMLPKDMSNKRAVEILNMRIKADDTEYSIFEVIEGYPLDSAACFYRVLQRRYGFTLSTTHEVLTFLGGKRKVKPEMKQIKVGPKSTDIVQVPIGAFVLPDFDAQIVCMWGKNQQNKWCFAISGTLKAKDRKSIQEIVAETNEEIRTNSIYRGKAIVLRAGVDGEAEFGIEPEFMETDNINPDELILSRETQERLDIHLFSLIKKKEECIKHGISLKQTVLIPGPFGTGKTMCARVVAKLCVDHGWTYIAVDKVETLPDALEFVRRGYEPAVVFAEDIDRITKSRDSTANTVMDRIDGILAKNAQVITILTTNNVEDITKAMMRFGRADAIVPIEAPDAEAAERLVRFYAGNMLAKNTKLDKLAKVIEGHVAATIAGIVKGALLGMISRGEGKITEEGLLLAAKNAQLHIDLLAEKKPNPISDAEQLGVSLKRLVNGHDLPGAISRIEQKVNEIKDGMF